MLEIGLTGFTFAHLKELVLTKLRIGNEDQFTSNFKMNGMIPQFSSQSNHTGPYYQYWFVILRNFSIKRTLRFQDWTS